MRYLSCARAASSLSVHPCDQVGRQSVAKKSPPIPTLVGTSSSGLTCPFHHVLDSMTQVTKGASTFAMTTSPASLGCTPSLRSVLPDGNTAATSAM